MEFFFWDIFFCDKFCLLEEVSPTPQLNLLNLPKVTNIYLWNKSGGKPNNAGQLEILKEKLIMNKKSRRTKQERRKERNNDEERKKTGRKERKSKINNKK